MKNNSTLLEPSVAAIFSPVIIVFIYFLIPYFEGKVGLEILLTSVLIAFLISAIHMILIGLPVVLLLRKFNYTRWWTLILVGVVAGCIPTAILTWPVDLTHGGGFSHWDGTKVVVLKENGIPTFAGWTEYIGVVIYMGAFGAICGLSFWYVQKKTSGKFNSN